jgi:hypothetical protein
VGLATAGGLAEIAAGVLGTAATWVASTGSRAAGGEAQTLRLVGAWFALGEQPAHLIGVAMCYASVPCACR